ncbi:MAG: alginate O-acetyltransferase AlgF [Litoreibacter sp.]|uniref:alginate O-acetyltransferase AlgF n=1 Tax=Litoreibacter sp. TaxID=1969459 RepID=UPI003299B917
MKRSIIGACVILLSTLSAASADDGLYENISDPNSSYVRVIALGQTVASIKGNTLRDLENGISAYVNVLPGDVDIVLPNGTIDLNVGASTYYTVVFDDAGEPTVFNDEITNSPAKADISIYNLSSADSVDLFVPAANAVAIAETTSNQSQTVSVRAPLTLDFEVHANGEVLAQIPQISLVRKAGVSIILLDGEDGFTALSTANIFFK